jgi:CDP-2,3-bis-(O-geranylgeranyl)-sn-glycerol synthase
VLQDIIVLIWLFLPLGLANTGPVIANNIPLFRRFNHPLDFGRTYRGKRIFGDHKTLRGIIAAALVGFLVAALQMVIHRYIFQVNNPLETGVNYGSPVVLLMGLCLGVGAITGDAIKSFFKRQMSIAPGKNWVPFDQLDFIVGGMFASMLFFIMPLELYITGFVVGLILHPTFNVLAWLLRLQDKPF